LGPIATWQAEVEQHQNWRVSPHDFQGGVPVSDEVNLVAFKHKASSEEAS
jgi:hypothetical protein